MKNNLERFLIAQERFYTIALEEIKNGKKKSHWMWYIFPQIQGLGMSDISKKYAIRDLEETRAYLENETLRNNIIEISEALLKNEGKNALEIMGYPDNMKLCSSMTLFAIADKKYNIFREILERFFNGEMDKKTLEILGVESMKNNV